MKAFVVYEGFCMVRNIYTMVLLIWFATRLFVCYVGFGELFRGS